jgi:hypothetical protein
MASLTFCIGSVAYAGQNPSFVLPMHGMWPATLTETCDTPAQNGVDCTATGRPTVNLPSGATGPAVMYLFVHEHIALKGVQTAFEFAPWTITFSSWDCQPGQLSLRTPANPGGPDTGILNTAFNCTTDRSLQVIGFMVLELTGSGCITQVQPTGSFFQALDCGLGLDEFAATGPNMARLGSVCIGSGGHDACFQVVPVESATWGAVKAQYR